mgnify:CR=1 FL=1
MILYGNIGYSAILKPVPTGKLVGNFYKYQTIEQQTNNTKFIFCNLGTWNSVICYSCIVNLQIFAMYAILNIVIARWYAFLDFSTSGYKHMIVFH